MEIVEYSKDSMFQRLKAYYIDENSVVLTEKEEQKLKRLLHIWGVRGTDYATTGFISNQSKKVSGRSHILTLIIKTGDIVTIFNYTNGNVAYHSQSIMPEFGDFSPKVSLSRGSSFNGTMEYKIL